jgi:putative membrane protein
MQNTSPARNSPERFEVRPTSDSHFGWIRTRLNLENTMMAWLRTAVSLIGFGFAIVQFLDRMRQASEVPPTHPMAPEYLGMALIACGVLALVIAIWQYRWMARYLRSGSFAQIAGVPERKMQSPIVVVALLLIFVGLFAFFAVLLRLP